MIRLPPEGFFPSGGFLSRFSNPSADRAAGGQTDAGGKKTDRLNGGPKPAFANNNGAALTDETGQRRPFSGAAFIEWPR